MRRCAILNDYQRVATKMADWRPLNLDLVVFDQPFATEAALLEAAGSFEIIVAMRERTPFPRAILSGLPKLKLLVSTGRRNPAIDLRAAEELGITVCGTDSPAHPTAELTWALILALVRHVPFEDANIRAGGRWQTRVGGDLHGKTLGLLGLGTLGTQVAKVGMAFGMRAIAWSNNLTKARCDEVGVEYVSKEGLIERSDVLSVHTQLSKRTEGLIDTPEFERMKRTAYLVNTSRGFIVRENALLDALQRGLIAGAALDVFEAEPLPADHPLRRAPNTVLTPHVGYVSEDTYRVFFGQVVENISAWLNGAAIRRMDPAINVDRSR